ncbi:MAG: hypothetical protein J7K22_02170 [Nanoarchaeota archaeon]|nr:hypothetical protein [Nanoarchaeota archaeon]
MPKNTVNFGLIPRGYGIAYNTQHRTIVFPPSRFAEAYAMVWPEKELKQVWREHSNYSFSELENGVKRVKGSLNLIKRQGVLKISDGGTVSNAIVKSRSHGGRKGSTGYRNPTVHLTAIKGLMQKHGEVSSLYDVVCGCEEAVYSRISDESRVYAVVCTHIAANVVAYELGLEDRINRCKPLIGDEIFIPYNITPDLVVKELQMRYIEGKKLFEIDVELLKNDILSDIVKNQLGRKFTFNCVKDCENYTSDVKYQMGKISKWLKDFGAKRTGIVLEDDGNCYWNYEIGNVDLRLIPDTNVKIMEVVYDEDFIKLIKDAPHEIKEIWHHPSIDPMRRFPRVYVINQVNSKAQLENIVNHAKGFN